MTGRILATVGIWGALLIALTIMLTTSTGAIANADGAVAFGIAFMLSIAAMASTIAIWVSRRPYLEDAQQVRGKAKRLERNRVQRLIENLDDEEIYELETLLLGRDEEQDSAKAVRFQTKD